MQFNKRKFSKPQLKQYLKKSGVNQRLINIYSSNLKVHDLCSLLCLHDNYVKGIRVRKERKKEMNKLIERAIREKHLYYKTEALGEVVTIFKTLIKNYKH